MLSIITIKGDSVESDGENRQMGFYSSLDVMGDGGRSLFSLRLLPDGSLEISASTMHAQHAGKAFTDKLVVRPMDSGRVTVGRVEAEPPPSRRTGD